ncbi:LacI family DNA-binding transcriptional regulator [Rhizobium paknamense]|uniref:LacI family transcriptional regulator n=1 Tax=Rhizobium paknamense TaxID=1206817 RepID=A0ABU0ID90_9HYPH|nr:LacI family DNA-binding transcriptional regulator [Rhizobium paknamense]MDQ0456207.1 LacI family transcriptional regulator [Rhizobium paknamense]
MTKPTVHDIAAHAGVSLATVDRVLNRRPGVRSETRIRVEEAIAALGYVRDVFAANLAKGRIYRFVFLLPGNDNSFMRALRGEVEAAALRASGDRMRIETVELPPFDAAAQAVALYGLLTEKPDGVALVAVDAPEVRTALDALVEAGLPVVTLVSDLPGSRRDHFAGIDNHAAGRTAASLLGRFLGHTPAKVAIMAGSLLVRDHRERAEGFQSVMQTDFPHLALLPVLEGRDEPQQVEALLGALLAEHPDLAGIYSLGAGNRGLIRALRAEKRPVVIAHELTATTRDALRAGQIDAVLNQDAGHEVRSAIRVLKALADGSSVVDAQERIRIDIFLKDNLP